MGQFAPARPETPSSTPLFSLPASANQFLSGGDDEAEVHEHLENCRRTPMHPGEWTQSEPGIRIWTPSNDLAQSRLIEFKLSDRSQTVAPAGRFGHGTAEWFCQVSEVGQLGQLHE